MNEIYQTLDTGEAWLAVLITLVITGLAGTIYFGLVSIKMKRESTFYLKLSVKGIVKLTNLIDENKLLTEKAERFKDMVEIIAMSNSKLRSELKECKEEREKLNYSAIENCKLRQIITELEKRNEYLKAIKNHKKRPIEEPETGWWTPKNNKYHQFTEGKIYEQSSRHNYANAILLRCNEDLFLVDKADFIPVAK